MTTLILAAIISLIICDLAALGIFLIVFKAITVSPAIENIFRSKANTHLSPNPTSDNTQTPAQHLDADEQEKIRRRREAEEQAFGEMLSYNQDVAYGVHPSHTEE